MNKLQRLAAMLTAFVLAFQIVALPVSADDTDVTEETDVVSDETDVEEEVEETVEEEVEETLEDIDSEEEAEDAIEDAEEEIKELEEELKDETDPAEREELKRRINRRRAYLMKLRIKLLQRYNNLGELLKELRAHDALYTVRWGQLVRTDNEAEKVEYNGEISVDSGELNAKKTMLFEANDELGTDSGDSIDWMSNINGHWDGLLVEYTADEDSEGDVNVTVSIGDLNKTLTGEEIYGRHEIGNGHYIEIKRFLPRLDKVADKLSDVRMKTRRLRLLSQSEDVDQLTERLEKILDRIEEYNYDDESLDEIEAQIVDLLADLADGATVADLESEIDTLEQALIDIKKDAVERKFKDKIIPFRDTDDDQWYTRFVAPMKARGIVSGFKDNQGRDIGEYRPGNNVTVAEALKIALNSIEAEISDADPALASAADHWAAKFVATAEEMGLDIVDDSGLDLNRQATRAEVVRIMLEAAGATPEAVSSTSFPDVDASHEHAAYIQLAFDLGIVSGDDDTGNFRPDAPINRAETAKVANQVIEIVLGEDLE